VGQDGAVHASWSKGGWGSVNAMRQERSGGPGGVFDCQVVTKARLMAHCYLDKSPGSCPPPCPTLRIEPVPPHSH
jgi:hypothetical protein